MGRGCLASNLCVGAGQVAVEMPRLYIQVDAFEDVNNKNMTAIENWVRHFCFILYIGFPRSGAYFGLVLFAISKISIFGFSIVLKVFML